MRVLAPGSLHLTLLFLGERPLEEIDPLAAALATAAGEREACDLELGAPLWLPFRHPRVLAVEVHDANGALAGLQAAVARELTRVCALEPPGRFRAHITVARTRGSAPAPSGEQLDPTPQAAFRADEVVLYRSFLEREGARYEPVASAALGERWGRS